MYAITLLHFEPSWAWCIEKNIFLNWLLNSNWHFIYSDPLRKIVLIYRCFMLGFICKKNVPLRTKQKAALHTYTQFSLLYTHTRPWPIREGFFFDFFVVSNSLEHADSIRKSPRYVTMDNPKWGEEGVCLFLEHNMHIPHHHHKVVAVCRRAQYKKVNCHSMFTTYVLRSGQGIPLPTV